MSYRVDRFAQEDVSDLQSLSGVAGGNTDLGTFTGNTIPDNQTTKQALQALETEVDDRLPDFVQWRLANKSGYASSGEAQNINRASFWQNIGLQDFTITADVRVDASGYYRTVRNPSTTEVQIVKASSTITTVVIGSQSYNFPSPALAAYTYHNITFVADRDGNGKLFTDGELTSTVDISSSSGQNLTGTIQAFAGQTSVQIGYRLQILNRAVTDAEAVLLSLGQYLGFADYGATGTYYYFSNRAGGFDTGVDGWTNNIGLSSLAIEDGVSDGATSYDDVLALTSNAGTTIHSGIKVVSPTIGGRYRLSGKYFVPSSNTASRGFQITTTGTIQTLFVGTQVGTWTDFEVEFIWTTGTAMVLYHLNASSQSTFTGVAGEKVYCRDLQLTPIGMVLDWNHNGAAPAICADASGNNRNATVAGATLINRQPLVADTFASLTNLPTSSAGLATGRVWNDGGTIKVV